MLPAIPMYAVSVVAELRNNICGREVLMFIPKPAPKAPDSYEVVPSNKLPLESIRIASAPPSANAIVSAAGKNMPVLVSPVVVIAGVPTAPAANVAVEDAARVVNDPAWLPLFVTMVPVSSGKVSVRLVLLLGLAMVNMPLPEASGAREILLTILPPPSFGYLHSKCIVLQALVQAHPTGRCLRSVPMKHKVWEG
jgi:hypothetical protein